MKREDVDIVCSALNEQLLHFYLSTEGCTIRDDKRGVYAWASRYQKGWEDRGWTVTIRPDHLVSRIFNYLAYGNDTWIVRISRG